MTVGQRFDALLANLKLTKDQRDDGSTKQAGVRTYLNAHYYSSSSSTVSSFLVGSWGKSTQVRPPRDIDVFFVLPYDVYTRYELKLGNRQSQLLQEVKGVLAAKYTNTKMRGDGQVVVVPFQSYAVEVAPVFKLKNGQYWICDTHDSGSYKVTDPDKEIAAVSASDTATSGNTRDLIRMMKCWQAYCNVPLKSFVIELLAIEFLLTWQYAKKSTTWYDYMTRDFFLFLKNKYSWDSVIVPGTFEPIPLGDTWKSRAETAYDRAVKACKYEADSMPNTAGEEWQKIFGPYIPIS